jgi:hypothetical protein
LANLTWSAANAINDLRMRRRFRPENRSK